MMVLLRLFGAARANQQRQVDDVGDLDRLSRLEGFGAVRLPALAMGEEHDLRFRSSREPRQASLAWPARRPVPGIAGAPKRIKHDKREADEHSRSGCRSPTMTGGSRAPRP